MKRNHIEIDKKRFHWQNYDRSVTAFHVLVSTDIPCDENLSATIIRFMPIPLILSDNFQDVHTLASFSIQAENPRCWRDDYYVGTWSLGEMYPRAPMNNR